MLNDGPRRQGRFLKKGSKVVDQIELLDFTFPDINQVSTISLDNPGRTIIHTKYHADSELTHAVRGPDKFNEDLMTPALKRQVIFPSDFTKDWERDKRLRKNRSSRLDDDDLEFELENASTTDGNEPPLMPPHPVKEPGPVQATSASSTNQTNATALSNASSSNKKPDASPDAVEHLRPQELPRYQSMDIVGKAIKSLMTPGEEGDAAAPLVSPETKFTPLTPALASEDLERQAMERHKQQLAEQKEHEEQLARELEEAKAKGYREGFRIGEEKAEVQARHTSAAMFGKITELMQEFQNLKHDILNNVQQNFYEICQAMAEALIQREFSIHPETFVAVLHRAIDEAVEPAALKIKVHPEMYDKILNLDVPEMTKSLVKDADLETGDFRIESDLSVVDVSVKKMIKELLQQADLGLFEKPSEADRQKVEQPKTEAQKAG